MKKNATNGLVAVLLFYFFGVKSFSQSALKEISLEKQIKNSELVIEGKVIEKKCFWDINHHNIYTRSTIEVFKVFKGVKVSEVEIVTSGGVIGAKALVVTPSLKLQKGDIGVFTLKNNIIHLDAENKSVNKMYTAYASVQSFYKYNLYTDIAVNPFSKKNGIGVSFYNEIMSFTKTDYIEMNSFNSNEAKSNESSKLLSPPTSITFVSSTISAGTKSLLTINGSGFGATKGKVGFSDADDGGSTFALALDSQVLTWNDTEITVEVPSSAGTGPILVQDVGLVNGFSASNLIVEYAELNVTFDPDDETGQTPPGSNGSLGFYAYPVRHVNDNTSGGYTWEMQTNFFDDSEHPGAKAAFETALDKWRCETKVNWEVSSSATTIDVVAADGINVVKFDNNTIPADDLPDGVLGRCNSWYSGCGIYGNVASWEWHVAELDIVFDDEETWFFGSGLPNTGVDFESVALHELGHGHQLGHVIDPTFNGDNLDDVMHYNISPLEQQRVLSTNNIAGGLDVHSRSTNIVACSQTVMSDSTNCSLSIKEDELINAITVYPNPAQNQFYIKNASFIALQKASIYDVSGRLISEHDISNTSRIKTIDLTGVSKGIYFVNIHSENNMITKKIVLE